MCNARVLTEMAHRCSDHAEELRRIIAATRHSDLQEYGRKHVDAVQHAETVLGDMIYQLADAMGVAKEV